MIEDTRLTAWETEGEEFLTCTICKDDFPADGVIVVIGYRQEEFPFCEPCRDKIREEK